MTRILAALFASVIATSAALAVNAHVYNLGDAALTTAVTNQVITSSVSSQGVAIAYADRLDGATAVTLQANFTFGATGTTLKVDVDTSLDQGISWVPVCRFAFTTASAEKVANLSGLTPKTTPYTPAVLSDDTCVDGMLGDRLRAKITTTGTYSANTSISVRASVR